MKYITTLLLFGFLSLTTQASGVSSEKTELSIDKEVTTLIQKCEELKKLNYEFNQLLHNSTDHQLIMQKRNARLQFKNDLIEALDSANLTDASTKELEELNQLKRELGIK